MSDTNPLGDERGKKKPEFSGRASVPPQPEGPEVPKGYVPEGDAMQQLKMAHMLVSIAIGVAIGSPVLAKVLDMHPLGNLYGGLWVLIALTTGFIGFNTKDAYASEDEVLKLCDRKLILALVSIGFSVLVWVIPTVVF